MNPDFYNNNFMLYICVISVLLLFFIKQIKFILKKLVNISFAYGIIYLINKILIDRFNAEKMCIGINFLTAALIFILNWPCVFFLYMLKGLF